MLRKLSCKVPVQLYYLGDLMEQQGSRGIGTVEAAVVFVVLCSILMLGVGLTDYLSRFQFVHALIEQSIDDSAVKPFRLKQGRGGQGMLQLNTSELRLYVSVLVEKVQREFEARDYAAYYIEAAYELASIDPHSGGFLDFTPASYYSQSIGNLALSDDAAGFSDLPRRFEQFAAIEHTQGVLRGASIVGVPFPAAASDSYPQRFMGGAVILGLRAYASFEATPARSAANFLGLDPCVGSYRVVQLRGVVE